MHLIERTGREVTAAMRACHASLDPEAPEDSRQLAAFLACDWQSVRPGFVGLAGGQGAGKTTLGRLLAEACGEREIRACVLSLDDFYLTRAERMALASRVHPLLETRGPPGTHDIPLCLEVLERLREETEVAVPVFDKGIDDRRGTRTLQGPFDLVIVEGWCVGARPATAAQLAMPINALEREEDADGRWRHHVNEALKGRYCTLWDALDVLIFLRVPGLRAVRRWRLEQEEARPAALRMDAQAVDRFVQHYDRITSAMWAAMPERADLVVELDEAHRIARLLGIAGG